MAEPLEVSDVLSSSGCGSSMLESGAKSARARTLRNSKRKREVHLGWAGVRGSGEALFSLFCVVQLLDAGRGATTDFLPLQKDDRGDQR